MFIRRLKCSALKTYSPTFERSPHVVVVIMLVCWYKWVCIILELY